MATHTQRGTRRRRSSDTSSPQILMTLKEAHNLARKPGGLLPEGGIGHKTFPVSSDAAESFFRKAGVTKKENLDVVARKDGGIRHVSAIALLHAARKAPIPSA